MDALTIIAVAFAAVAFASAAFVVAACLVPPVEPLSSLPLATRPLRLPVSAPAVSGTPARPVATLARRSVYHLNAGRLDLIMAAKSWASDRVPLGGVSAFAVRMADMDPYQVPDEHINRN